MGAGARWGSQGVGPDGSGGQMGVGVMGSDGSRARWGGARWERSKMGVQGVEPDRSGDQMEVEPGDGARLGVGQTGSQAGGARQED